MLFPHVNTPKTLRFLHAAILTAGAVLCAAPALAADNATLSHARAAYQRDRALCNSGQSNEDRATCLKEAGAAYEAAKRGQLLSDDPAQYARNALERCNAQPPQDRRECRRRIQGDAIIDGSVDEGGILRKEVTYETIPSDQPPEQNRH